MGMFGMDDDWWENYHSKMHHANLRKGNVGEHPQRWGGLPKELFPGYVPSIAKNDLDGYRIPDTLGGGKVGKWEVSYSHNKDGVYILRRPLEDHEDANITTMIPPVALIEFRKFKTIKYSVNFPSSPIIFAASGYLPTSTDEEIMLFYSLQDWCDGNASLLETVRHMKDYVDQRLIEIIKDVE
jgi:hypothetical protein